MTILLEDINKLICRTCTFGVCVQVRRTFTADRRNGKKNTLIVADYGQLELRILAHLTNCRSMLEAFKSGGDFHSRTALGMYDNIKEAVKKGKQDMLKSNLIICAENSRQHLLLNILSSNSWAIFPTSMLSMHIYQLT